MPKKSISLLLLLILLSCADEPSFTLNAEHFSEKELAICEEEPCSSVEIDYPKASGDIDLSHKVNTKIEQWIAGVLFLGEDEIPAVKNIEEAAKDFILAYRDYQADLPATITSEGYEAQIEVAVGLEKGNLLCLAMDHYLYTGGAHGYGAVTFLNLDKKTGEALQPEQLFSDVQAVAKIAEDAFRIQHDIAPDANINETGFWFENDRFHLPQTVGFTESSLYLNYNPYEIAPYSEGIIVLEVPLESIDPYLNFE